MASVRFSFYPFTANTIVGLARQWELIDFEPVYQRRPGVWNTFRQQLFIDSIINGMDLPKIYFHELPLASTSHFRFAIIDGKQRLQSIRDFMDGRLKLANDFEFLHDTTMNASGLSYDELLLKFPTMRSSFDMTNLPIMVMRAEDEVIIEGLFTRLNEAAALTAPEKRNAFGGPLPAVIRRLSMHSFFLNNLPFPDERYRHRDIAAKFLYIARERSFVDIKKEHLDSLVRSYRPPFPNGAPLVGYEELEQRTTEVLDAMSQWFKKNDSLLDNVGWAILFFYIFMFNRGPLPEGNRHYFEEFIDTLVANRQIVRAQAEGKAVPKSWTPNVRLGQFDALRQSPNDAGTFRTRYAILRTWFETRGAWNLPEPWVL